MAAAQPINIDIMFEGKHFDQLKDDGFFVERATTAIRWCIDNLNRDALDKLLSALDRHGFRTPEGLAWLNSDKFAIGHRYNEVGKTPLPTSFSTEQKVEAIRPQSVLFYSASTRPDITKILFDFGFRAVFEISGENLRYNGGPSNKANTELNLERLRNLGYAGGRKSKKRRGLRRRRSRRNYVRMN